MIINFRNLKILIRREITYLKLIIFGSSIPILDQLVWYLYAFLTSLKSHKLKTSKKRKLFYKNGFVDIGCISQEDNFQIKRIVEKEFNDIKPSQSLARKMNDDLAVYIFNILNKFRSEISSIMGSNFQTSFIEVIKTMPCLIENKDSSFAWHYDDEPRQMIKLFIYLNDTDKINGAFRTFNTKITRKLFAKKFISNTKYDRIRSQDLITKQISEKSSWIERDSGSIFCFDNSLIHRATYPIAGERTIISLILYNSFDKITLENVKKSLSKQISSYPKLPWENPCKK